MTGPACPSMVSAHSPFHSIGRRAFTLGFRWAPNMLHVAAFWVVAVARAAGRVLLSPASPPAFGTACMVC